MKTTVKKLKAIDLFAGIGGIRKGFEDNGFEFLYSNDFDVHAAKTYKENFGEIDTTDIRNIDERKLPNFDVLLAGFPCQAFSIAGLKKGFADTRGTLFFELERILAAKKPRAFLLENVRALESHDKGRTLKTILAVLENKLKYDVHYKIINAKDFGVPQNRPRIYIVGFRKKTNFQFPIGNSKTKLKQILEKSVDPKYYISQKYFEGLERHKQRHASRGNGFGYQVLNPNEVSNALVVGGMGRERNLVRDRPVLIWKEGMDKLQYKNIFGIRKLTIRECARLQGFDDKFVFPVANTHAYKQLGNSVAIPVIRAIAREMKKHL